MNVKLRSAVLAWFAFAALGHADDIERASNTAPTHCAWDDFMYGEAKISVGEIRKSAGPRVHFLKYAGHCGKDPQHACPDRAYLVPGDAVAIAKHHDTLACAWYNRTQVNDEVVGWLPQSALEETAPPEAPALANWTKAWSRFISLGNESNVTITRDADGNSLHVVGSAEWMGGGATEPHLGEFEGSAQPQGNRLVIHSNVCVVEMFLLDDYHLFARDHFDCGGMNVTFRGLY